MRGLGYLIMASGVITWLVGIKLQAANPGQFEKWVIFSGQMVVVLGGITQIITRVRSKK
jgi:hypothetical protein